MNEPYTRRIKKIGKRYLVYKICSQLKIISGLAMACPLQEVLLISQQKTSDNEEKKDTSDFSSYSELGKIFNVQTKYDSFILISIIAGIV